VTNFQNRGRRHDHGLLWIKDAPIYRKNVEIFFENFVDKYLSCDSTTIGYD
jgi:hypothetical protein